MGALPCTSAGWQRSASRRSASPSAAVIWSMTLQGAPAVEHQGAFETTAPRVWAPHLVHDAAGRACMCERGGGVRYHAGASSRSALVSAAVIWSLTQQGAPAGITPQCISDKRIALPVCLLGISLAPCCHRHRTTATCSMQPPRTKTRPTYNRHRTTTRETHATSSGKQATYLRPRSPPAGTAAPAHAPPAACCRLPR